MSDRTRPHTEHKPRMTATATSDPPTQARKLSVPQMLRLMQLEVEKASRHRYSISCILASVDGFDGEEHEGDDAHRMAVMPQVFRVLKHITFQRKVQGLGFWTEKVVLAVFPHVSPSEISELGDSLVVGTEAIPRPEGIGERPLTFSAGVAHNQHSGPMSLEILIREAETGLSMAQKGGGGRCVQWLEVESELDRLREELEEQMAEVDRQSQAFAEEQDALAEKRGRSFVEKIQATFSKEQQSEAVVRLEKEMIALAMGVVAEWRESSLAQELARSQSQIDNLERRVRKLTDLLDVTESELKRVAAMKNVDLGIASIYRQVQGLSDDDANAEVKRELMKSIFEANLALVGKQATED